VAFSRVLPSQQIVAAATTRDDRLNIGNNAAAAPLLRRAPFPH